MHQPRPSLSATLPDAARLIPPGPPSSSSSSSSSSSAVEPGPGPGPATPLRTGAAAAAAGPRKRRRRGRRWFWLVVLLVAILGGGGFLLRGRQTPPLAVTVEPALRKTVTQLVTATGKVQPEVEIKISPEVAGEIIELPVVDGQTVRRGDLLLRIKPDNYKAQVAQQEAAISAAKAVNLQNQASLLKAELDLRRSQDLYNKHIISDSDLDTARTTAAVARATQEASRYQIMQAESQLNQAKDLLEKTTVLSPLDGTVTLVNSRLGERVVATGQFAGTDVMHVADLRTMEARVNVNENDVVNVKIGDPAAITVDAYPNRVFRGTVYQIANTAATTGANTQEEVTNFEVRIRINNEQAALRPGMSTTSDVQTATVTGALAVPIQAVTVRESGDQLSPEERQRAAARAKAGEADSADQVELNRSKQLAADKAVRAKQRQVVFVKQGDVVRLREVETGIASTSEIEIKAGLRPGEEVVSGPYRAISRLLKDGARVILEKNVAP